MGTHMWVYGTCICPHYVCILYSMNMHTIFFCCIYFFCNNKTHRTALKKIVVEDLIM